MFIMSNDFFENEIPIFTNNLKLTINRQAVENVFDVFRVSTKNSNFNNNVFDVATDRFKAQSVAYYPKNRWFAMFKKDSVIFEDFKSEVQKMDSSAIVNSVNLHDTDERSLASIMDVELAQLLVNSLKNRNNDLFAYNNLTGSLYYSFCKNQKATSLELLKLRFYSPERKSTSIALEADTETFSEYEMLKKYGKKAEKNYVFDEDSGELRKSIKSDFEKKCRFFDNKAISRKGSRKKFLDGLNSSYENFSKSKVGIIATFFEDVKENLSEFITMEQIPFTKYNSYDAQKSNYENTDYAELLQKRGVCVVDEVGTPESEDMKNKMSDFLRTEYHINEIHYERMPGKYIIEIIHDKDSDFYAKREDDEMLPFEEFKRPTDQHNLFGKDDIIQHITVENSAERINCESIKDVMHNIVQEVLIKGDLHDRQISLVNWNEQKDWTFVMRGTGLKNEAKNIYEFIYYKMCISKNGRITFETFDSKNYSADEFWNTIDSIFRFYKDERCKSSKIDCIIYSDVSNINVIYKTKQFTLPNVEVLSQTIKDSDVKNKICKTEIIRFIDEYLSQNNFSDSEKLPFEKMKKNIEDADSSLVSYYDILHSNNAGKREDLIKKKVISEFVDWLHENKNILLHAQIKRGENMYKNLNSFLGVKSMELDGKFKYFVGKKKEAVQLSLHHSCKIRDVIPWNEYGECPNGKILFDEFAHMLTVEFVRNGQYTIVPFPIKYLREYIKFCEKDEEV